MENKYKAKYLEFSNKQIGGSKTLDIVILHHPITKNTKIPKDMKPIIKKLSKLNIANIKIHNYWFKFAQNNFD